jgi:hypothetical protein
MKIKNEEEVDQLRAKEEVDQLRAKEEVDRHRANGLVFLLTIAAGAAYYFWVTRRP